MSHGENKNLHRALTSLRQKKKNRLGGSKFMYSTSKYVDKKQITRQSEDSIQQYGVYVLRVWFCVGGRERYLCTCNDLLHGHGHPIIMKLGRRVVYVGGTIQQLILPPGRGASFLRVVSFFLPH